MTFDLTCTGDPFVLEGTFAHETCETRSGTPQNAGKRVSTSEGRDDYSKVLFYLSERWRVIECRDGIQWILQYRRSMKNKNSWRGVSFCVERRGLEMFIKEKAHINIDLSQFLKERFYD